MSAAFPSGLRQLLRGFFCYSFCVRIFSYFREHTLVSGVAILGLTQLGASVVGLLRERILNTVFADDLSVVDAYLAAFRPSDLMFQACILSAMGTVLVPVLATHYAKGNSNEMSRVLSGTTCIAAVVFGFIALLLAIFFPWIAPFLVQFEGETLDLYITFGRLALLVNFFFVFGNALGQYLITVQRYWIYGITPIIYTLGTIFGAVFLTPTFGTFGPMYGTILGVLLYVFFRLLAAFRSGARPMFTLWHPEVPAMVKLMLPRVFAFGAFQFQLLFLDRIASGFPRGAVTINNNARNFQSVLVGVVGIAIAQSVYSILSQAAANKQPERFSKYFSTGMWLCLALTIPGAIVLGMLSPLAASLVHLSDHLPTFTIFMICYAISIPFESMTHLQYRAFYAMKETMLPATMGVLGGAAAIIAAALLTPQFGVYSIAIGYTLGEIIQAGGLAILLPRTIAKHMPAEVAA